MERFGYDCGYMQKHKKTLIWVGAIVVVAIVAVLINHRYRQVKTPTPLEETPSVATPETTPIAPRSPKQTVSNTVHNYTQDLVRYGSKRVQFSAQCDPNPKRAVFAKGETIMIDNRSPEMHGFTIGSQNIVIPAYDYALVPLFEKGTFLVNCGTLTNAATIIVQ